MHTRSTARLLLRDIDHDDAIEIASMMSDARVNTFFYGFQQQRSEEELLAYVESYFFAPFAAARAACGVGGFTIHERGDSDAGEFVGVTGLFPATAHHPEHGPELIYVLKAAHHGKGYAVEAAGAVIEEVRRTSKLASLSLTTDAPNAGSRIVAERLGFTELGRVTAYGSDDMVFYVKPLRA